MESGINADQNFYSRRLLSQSPDRSQQPQHLYDAATLPDSNLRSPVVPPKLPFLTTANLQAATTHGFGGGLGGIEDPDDFYRDYRGVQSSNTQPDVGRDAMSPISQTTRSNPTSLRSNSNGATPKHPPVSASRKAAVKPSYRSVSLGAEEGTAAAAATTTTASNNAKSTPTSDRYGRSPPQSSVKDMVKRFDPNSGRTKPASTKSTPRTTITKDPPSSGVGSSKGRSAYSTRTAGETSNTVGRSATGSVSRESGPARSVPSNTKPTHRTRFAVEERQPSKPPSSSSRDTRPRRFSGSMAHASKSMTNLSPAAAATPPLSSLPQTRRPLFGEIVSTGRESQSIAYGIPRTAVRRTSDSNLHPPTWTRRRRQSDADVSPSSPTAWYLGVAPTLDDIDPYRSRMKSVHNRAHSDFADSKVNTMNGVDPITFQPPQTSPPPRPASDDRDKSTTVPSQSRIPVIATRLGYHSDSSNPSSRANSPYANRPSSSSRLRKPDPSPWAPSSRAATPSRSPRGRNKAPEKLHPTNASLKAYISAPPPKLSPPLRSSRPRQPVSSAVNYSSKRPADGVPLQKETKSGMRLTRNLSNSGPKSPRKIITGPVDFAARRERIQRAYTKSIHESEQREIRAANLRRLNERRKNEEAAASIAEKVETAETEPMAASEDALAAPERSNPAPAEMSPNLHLSTSFHKPSVSNVIATSPNFITDDSPTLGIPGSYVVDDDEAPPSAISNTATEIENEPQTEAPQPSHVPTEISLPPIRHSTQPTGLNGWTTDTLSSQKGYSGEFSGSIQILLDTAETTSPPLETTPTATAFTRTSPPPSDLNQQTEENLYKEPEDNSYNEPVSTTILEPNNLELASPILSNADTQRGYPDDEVSPNPTTIEDEDIDVHEASHQNLLTEGDVPGMFPITPEIDQYPNQLPEIAPRLELPMLRTALAPSSVGSVGGQDYPGTPLTDMESDGSEALEDTSASGPDTSRPLYQDSSLYQDSGLYLAPRVYRPSLQSSWTDETVHTVEGTLSYGDYQYPLQNTEYVDTTRRPSPPPKELPTPELPPKPDSYSPRPSPNVSTDTPIFNLPNFQQLPPLVTGEGLGLGFSDESPEDNTNVIPMWPDHSPPPIPQEEFSEMSPVYHTQMSPPPSLYNRRPPSSIYRTSHDPESRRDSDDIYSLRGSLSTPRSSTQISLEDVSATQFVDGISPKPVPETEEERKAVEKETKRLFKRRMLIKELLDTESVYLKDMNVVEEIYKGTAEACPKLDADDIRAIFRNTDEVVIFSTMFLDELKSASSSVYSSRSNRSRQSRVTTATTGTSSTAEERFSMAGTLTEESDEPKDRKTFIGATFGKHLANMQEVYTNFLKNSEVASSRLAVLQEDGAVKVWLDECNLVAKDLTAAWSLDALLVKPVQRITRYQLLLHQIYECTPTDHPDHGALKSSCDELGRLLKNIDDLKKRIHMVGKIVNRKRKESDVRSGLAKAFGRRAEKLQLSSSNRPPEDEGYQKLHEKFGDDYLRLQVVLRDVEYYTRQVSTYVTDFLRYLSAMELIMRMSASPYPELESKWARFNMSMRDMGTIALEDHVNNVRKRVIKPFEQVIQAYGPPGLAMKKRSKRRLDYEKSLSLKSSGKKIDDKLKELIDQYEALNETLKFELPKLSQLTEKVGNMCLIQFIHLQTEWYSIWQDKVRVVLEDSQVPKNISDIVTMFNRDFKYVQARAQEFGIVNGTFLESNMSARASQSTRDDESMRSKPRPSNLTTRPRGLSVTSDKSPSLPTPDFAKRLSGQFNFATMMASNPGLPPVSYQGPSPHARSGSSSGSPANPEPSPGRPSLASSMGRPSTGRSYTSDVGNPRISTDFNGQYRRESGSTYNSHYVDGPPHTASSRPYSGIFHSAMPLSDGPEDSSQRSSRASSHDRNISGGYNVLYLAASLFEFNIAATKSEAGYPYLTYQAGEIFDVIGEKGELWLAKNQDDPTDTVGWIWSKHFARLAAD
ncbi:hypothetical protein B7463_g2723, partial [Scytalidium lignicola]